MKSSSSWVGLRKTSRDVLSVYVVTESMSVRKTKRPHTGCDIDGQTDGQKGVCICAAVCVQKQTSATVPAGKRQFSWICCHSNASRHVCVCAYVCMCVSATDCLHIWTWREIWQTDRQSEAGRPRQSQATKHVISVRTLCYLLRVIVMKSYISFPECVFLVVRWVWLLWSQYKTVNHGSLCVCACFLFACLHVCVCKCTTLWISAFLFMHA